MSTSTDTFTALARPARPSTYSTARCHLVDAAVAVVDDAAVAVVEDVASDRLFASHTDWGGRGGGDY